MGQREEGREAAREARVVECDPSIAVFTDRPPHVSKSAFGIGRVLSAGDGRGGERTGSDHAACRGRTLRVNSRSRAGSARCCGPRARECAPRQHDGALFSKTPEDIFLPGMRDRSALWPRLAFGVRPNFVYFGDNSFAIRFGARVTSAGSPR